MSTDPQPVTINTPQEAAASLRALIAGGVFAEGAEKREFGKIAARLEKLDQGQESKAYLELRDRIFPEEIEQPDMQHHVDALVTYRDRLASRHHGVELYDDDKDHNFGAYLSVQRGYHGGGFER